MRLSRALPIVLASAVALGAAPADPSAEVARLVCSVEESGGLVACESAPGAPELAALVGSGTRSGDVWTIALSVRNRSALGFDGGGVEAHVTRGAVETVLRYPGALAPGETTAATPLRLRAGAEPVTFEVAVRATVTFPRGRVAVSPAAVRVLASGTEPLAASPRATSGAALPGALVRWSTADAAVATVSPAGVVTGVAPGATVVTAREGAASTAVAVTVCPDLAVGEVYQTTLATGESVCVGGYGGAEYTVVPTNPSGAAALAVTATATGVTSAGGPPNPLTAEPPTALRLTIDGAATAALADDPAPDDAADLARVERDRAATVAALARGAASPPPAARRPPPAVGDLLTFNVAPGCDGARDERTGTVQRVSANAVLVYDNGNPSGGFDAARTDSLVARFERVAWPAITNAFGTPTDLDGNGRVVLFLTRAVNERTPVSSSVVNEGYVASRDLLSASACPRSNEGEVIYLLAPDPNGTVNSNVRTISFVEGSSTRASGRELVRLVNASRRIVVLGAPLEEPWLDLGLSYVGEELMFYRTSAGLAPRQNINLPMLTSGPASQRRVNAFNTYANQNFGRYRGWLQRPDTSSVFTSSRGGGTWALLRYLADRQSGDQSAFWASLVSDQTGLDNLRAALGLATTDEALAWVRDWTVAAYADDAVPAAAARYQTLSWNFRSLFAALGGVPNATRPLADGVPLALTLARGGGTVYYRFGVPASTVAGVRVSTTGGVVPVSVLRTK